MARIYKDRVGETTATTGTDPFSLSGKLPGYQAFGTVAAVGDTFDYAAFAVDANGVPTGDWETGGGTFLNGDSIARAVQESSNGGQLVNFAAGSKTVLLTENAQSIVQMLAAIAAGGGGGGGVAITVPQIVQQASRSQHGNGNLNLNLPQAPTPGNMFVLIWTGAGGNNPSDMPPNFTLLAFAANGSGPMQQYYPGLGQIYQGAYAACYRVQQGDGAGLSVPCGGDANNFLLLEVTDFDIVFAHIDRMATDPAVNNGLIGKRQRPPHAALHIAILEQDNGDAMAVTSAGATKIADMILNGGNHFATAWQLADKSGDVKVTVAAAPKYPEIMFLSLAKYPTQ